MVEGWFQIEKIEILSDRERLTASAGPDDIEASGWITPRGGKVYLYEKVCHCAKLPLRIVQGQ